MRFRVCAFLVFCGLAFGGCSPVAEQNQNRAQLDLALQFCAIGYAAIIEMRKLRVLADPDMVANCPRSDRVPLVDISPRQGIAAPQSRWTQAYYDYMIGRKFPVAVVDRLITSVAFEALIDMRKKIERLSANP